MRTLVLQLARFGDIYQTWPTLKALKRLSPKGELHVLVRERFHQALNGLDGVTVHVWPTADILAPIYEFGDIESAQAGLAQILKPLSDLKFDRILNLSFSPLSSYLTDVLSEGESGSRAEVSGYTRFADGYLSIPDDTSAYFYAQVGTGRSNRYHITDLFASVAGVDLTESDFSSSNVAAEDRRDVVIHMGASQHNKTYPPEMWVKVIQKISLSLSVADSIRLVGSADEAALAAAVIGQLQNSESVLNSVGQTSLTELMAILSNARLLIGADSAPVHMAALTATPVLNLSCPYVNFWETGPHSAGSRVLFAHDLSALSSETIAIEAMSMIRGEEPVWAEVVRPSCLEPFQAIRATESLSWKLTEAIYTNCDYPALTSQRDLLSMQRLNELADLALRQFESFRNKPSNTMALNILAEVDGMISKVARVNPVVRPLVEWFETERLRIPPGTIEQTLERSEQVFQNLLLVTSVYYSNQNVHELVKNALDQSEECIHPLREYEFSGIESRFQNLVSNLHSLARHSPKVGESTWSSVLSGMTQALEARDYIKVADILQWDLVPTLRSL